jgi:hypothetical protein
MGHEIDFAKNGAVKTRAALERRLVWFSVIAYLLESTETEERLGFNTCCWPWGDAIVDVDRCRLRGD